MLEIFQDVALDALIDTLRMAPLLYVVYVVIEFATYKYGDRLGPAMTRAGKAGPMVGALAGIVPQCGVSAVASALYTQRMLTIGTLFAVYLATSDEAIPVILSRPDALGALVPLILTKLVIAIVFGYVIDVLFARRNKRMIEELEASYAVVGELQDDGSILQPDGTLVCPDGSVQLPDGAVVYQDGRVRLPDGNVVVPDPEGTSERDQAALLSRAAAEKAANMCFCGACTPVSDDGTLPIRELLWYPFLHTLQVSGFILVVSFALGMVFALVGEDTVAAWLAGHTILQPIVAALIGIIPNCAVSVVVTELYIDGALTFGATIAGLCAGGGLGVLLLLEEDRDRREAIAIVVGLFVLSVVAGLIVQALGIAA